MTRPPCMRGVQRVPRGMNARALLSHHVHRFESRRHRAHPAFRGCSHLGNSELASSATPRSYEISHSSK